VGIALWLACGIVAVTVARIVPASRQVQLLTDAATGVVTALLAGVVATALDFGGWNEPDWRAGLFVLMTALASLGWLRVLRRKNRPARPAARA
jgi:uncharacterized membrane protein YeaQ/YmgE (transglycosylase-associated protein family)